MVTQRVVAVGVWGGEILYCIEWLLFNHTCVILPLQGKVYNALIEAFLRGDNAEALRLQRIAQASIDPLLDAGRYGGSGIHVGKAVMEIRLGGKHVGPPRYPGDAMSADAKALLTADLTAAGFFNETL